MAVRSICERVRRRRHSHPARRHLRRRRKRVRRRQRFWFPLPLGEGFLPNWICINKPELKYEKADFLNFARNRFLWLLLGTHASAKAKESRSAGDSDSQCDLVDNRARRFAKH